MAKLFANDIESIRLFRERMCFQSIFVANPIIPSKDGQGYFPGEAIILSDDDANLNFGSSNFVKKYGLKPIGIWCGHVKTLENLEAPIYRVDLKLNTAYGGQVVSILAISTDEIGLRTKALDKVMATIGKMFNVDHRRSLANPHVEIDLLIGLDDQ